jgi:hypothetical protein
MGNASVHSFVKTPTTSPGILRQFRIDHMIFMKKLKDAERNHPRINSLFTDLNYMFYYIGQYQQQNPNNMKELNRMCKWFLGQLEQIKMNPQVFATSFLWIIVWNYEMVKRKCSLINPAIKHMAQLKIFIKLQRNLLIRLENHISSNAFLKYYNSLIKEKFIVTVLVYTKLKVTQCSIKRLLSSNIKKYETETYTYNERIVMIRLIALGYDKLGATNTKWCYMRQDIDRQNKNHPVAKQSK